MFRKVVPSKELKYLSASWRSSTAATTPRPRFNVAPSPLSHFINGSLTSLSSSSPSSTTPFQRPGISHSGTSLKRKAEDMIPIATGHEREELEAELVGRNILEINYPVGPFGTKESPAVVKSVYDKRIVGCPGGEGEDEHDVVWFWLEKGKPYECPVCSQCFMLEVVGPGGPPDGHGDDHH